MLRRDMLECQSDELHFQTKVELACMARANELLTHCTLGVSLKCQASVERLVATGRQTQHTTNMV